MIDTMNGPPGAQPWRRELWISLAAILAVLAGFEIFLAIHHSGSPGASGLPDNIPKTIVKNGKTLYAQTHESFHGVVVDETDPALLHVLVDPEPNDPGSDEDCLGVNPIARVSREKSDAVVVDVVRYYERSSAGSGSYSCGYSVLDAAYKQLPLQLQHPLGTRKVRNAFGESSSVVFAKDVPKATAVPRGYVGEPVTIDDSYLWRAPQSTQPPPPSNDLSFVLGLRVYRNGSDVLEIREGRPQYLMPYGNVVKEVPIRSASASLTDDSCLTWTEGSERAIQVCAQEPGISTGGSPTMTDGELIKVARSLR